MGPYVGDGDVAGCLIAFDYLDISRLGKCDSRDASSLQNTGQLCFVRILVGRQELASAIASKMLRFVLSTRHIISGAQELPTGTWVVKME
jgi:hypothetical protein